MRVNSIVLMCALAVALDGQVLIISDVGHDKSIPLRDMKHVEVTHRGEAEHGPLVPPLPSFLRVTSASRLIDPALQPASPQPSAPLSIFKFAGQGYGFPGYADEYIPPDTNGSVGLTQYVQWVNGTFAVFNKSSGSLVSGPFAGNTLWQGFGGLCENNNAGDPIAQYDKVHDRWVMAQFTGGEDTTYFECFAISETDDATGAWYRYAFPMPYFNDYPKIGIWPDAYYGTFNFFDGSLFREGEACAFQSSAMLVGAPATAQCFGTTLHSSLLPSDLDGDTPPPAGAPNFLVSLDFSVQNEDLQLLQLDLWQFHVDWNTPANSTFQQTAVLSVAPYTPACSSYAPSPYTCIVQPGTTQPLASLGDRLMYRLAYRNFVSYESLVVNHSVDVDTGLGNEGVRWYEIRNPSTAPYVYQQSTFAPDSQSRWMGSMVMDNAGNIALGYGASGSLINPSVRFTGRLASDPLNTMESEVTMVQGTGAQVPVGGEPAMRWGDYSSFSVDPVDDCTLWYTHEYMATTGDFTWSTVIGAVSFPTCQPLGRNPNLVVTATPAAITVDQTVPSSLTVGIGLTNGFSAEVSLSATGLPAGSTAVFFPASIPAPGGGVSTLTITPGATAAAGTYTLTITATGGGVTRTATVQVTVLNFVGVSLSSSANPSPSGKNVTVTASVSPTSDSGSITFFDGITILGARALTGGKASLTTNLLLPGSHSLKALYNGGGTNGVETSTVLAQAITPVPASGFRPEVVSGAGYFELYDLATGDFNGDSNLDLVVQGAGNTYEFAGNGDGTFQPPIALPTTFGTLYPISVGDFNGDGKTDIVGTGALSAITVLLSNGDGTFQSMTLTRGISPVVADFNGDGKADIAYVQMNAIPLSTADAVIALGNGDGTFQTPINYPASTLSPSALLAVGDFNGDGKADLVLGAYLNGNLMVLLGNGDGTFQPPVGYSVGFYLSSISVGDVNADGRADLLVGLGVGVAVLLANSDGTFQPPMIVANGIGVSSVAVADFDGDGKLDLALAGQSGSVYTVSGNGDGTFQAPVSYPTSTTSYSLVAGDFNRDGRPDLAVSEAEGIGIFLANPVYAATSTTLVSALNPANWSQSVALTATVSPAAATGTVTFRSGSATLGTATLTAGVATLVTSTLPAGADSLSAVYSGDLSYSPSTGTITEQVGCAGIAPGALFGDSTGAPQTLTISAASSSCAWTASTTYPWIQLSATSGTGAGMITVTSPPNTTGADLGGAITFGAQTIGVTQRYTAEVFNDVSPSVYYFDAVNLLSAKAITAGCSASPPDYCPSNPVTRAQMAVFIVRSVYGGDNFTASTTPYFQDVGPADFGFAWIQKMYELGITSGCGNDDYCPNNSVTRAQMAIFIIRARYGSSASFDFNPTAFFTDVPAGAFGFNWIQRMKMDNITSGCGPATYCPNESVTRGDMAIFLMRGGFNQLLPAGEPVLSSINPATIAQGASGLFTVTGVTTNFVNGTTTIGAIPGITVGTVTVASPTTLVVQLTATSDAVQQPVSVFAITGTPPGNEEAVLPNGLVVQ